MLEPPRSEPLKVHSQGGSDGRQAEPMPYGFCGTTFFGATSPRCTEMKTHPVSIFESKRPKPDGSINWKCLSATFRRLRTQSALSGSKIKPPALPEVYDYYEHVIRDDAEWNRAHEYIVYNPERWGEDAENPNNKPEEGRDSGPGLGTKFCGRSSVGRQREEDRHGGCLC